MVLFFVRGEVESDKLIRYCYSHYRNIVPTSLPENVNILREEGKKPSLDIEGVHFNLSHSSGVTMVGFSHAPIGVDIEKVREIDPKKFPFIEAEDEEDFFKKWTQRESYVKLTGEGLKAIKRAEPTEDEDVCFEHFDVFDGYHACVASEPQSVIAYELAPEFIE